MDEAIAQLMSLGTIVLGVSVYIGVALIRRLVETQWPGLKQKAPEDDKEVTYGSVGARWYNKVVLYFLPPVLGGVVGLFEVPFIFGETITSMGGRIFFGIVVGWFSSLLYKVLTGGIEKQTGVKVST